MKEALIVEDECVLLCLSYTLLIHSFKLENFYVLGSLEHFESLSSSSSSSLYSANMFLYVRSGQIQIHRSPA